MKFTTETNTLKEALQRLGFGINSRSALPVLGNILVTVQKGSVLLTTTDLMVTINYGIECETDGEGQFLIPFLQLKNIVALETGSVTITWQEKKGVVTKFEKDVFSLGNAGEVTDFPKIPKVPQKGMLELEGEFIGALKMAALGVSKDDNVPVLHNICLELDKKALTIISTDKFTIYSHSIEGKFEVEERTELLVPNVVAKVLDGFESAKIGFNKNHMAFESGPVLITAKRAEGKFPNWRNVMPAHTANMNLNIDDLRNAVGKAYVVSDATYNGIDFMMAPAELDLVAKDADTGMNCSCKIPAESTSEITHLRFNGRLLKRMLAQFDHYVVGEGQVQFSITEQNKPVTMQLAGKQNVTVLIVPITI